MGGIGGIGGRRRGSTALSVMPPSIPSATTVELLCEGEEVIMIVWLSLVA